MFWAALSMTAALVMTACSNDDNDMTEAPVAPSTSKTIPYTVTVSGEEATTRATVDNNNKTLRFATGDKLYITGTDIQGVLNITAGVGESSGATFSGDLTYSGSGSPSDGLSLTATLVSAQQTVGNQVSVDGAGAVTVNYPIAAYCTSVNDAVQQYSKLTGTSTYGAKAFSLTQQTAFLNFVITFDDGTTTSGTTLSAVVSNNSSTICKADVTTTTENGNVVAKFVLPVASSTTLTSPTVKMGDKDAISFSGATLAAKVYNVKRTYNHPDAISGKFSVSSTKQVYFSKGNLQATKSDNGGTWTWHFATNQYARVGGKDKDGNGTSTGNNYINGNGTVTNDGNGKNIDLFGWSTSSTHPGISNSTNNNDYIGDFVDWGSATEVTNCIGTGWRTLTSDEWRYLTSTRSGNRFALASINGTRGGIILLPDDWETSYYTLSSINNASVAFTTNTITNANWSSKLEAHGAVFLPVTGQRNSGTKVNGADVQLHYWSSSKNNTDTGTGANATHLRFMPSGDSNARLAPDAGAGRCNGFSVRLVRDVK